GRGPAKVYWKRFSSRQALWPPKPKLLDRMMSTFFSRGPLGM
ncbi:hypothetical protein LCGC14_2383290, partial [marine sediment metagenome]